jgi:cytochrome P450
VCVSRSLRKHAWTDPADSLTFTLEFLSRHADVQQQLQAEVENFRGTEIDIGKIAPVRGGVMRSPWSTTARTQPNLPVLHAVLNETLRVRPVVPSKVRSMQGYCVAAAS